VLFKNGLPGGIELGEVSLDGGMSPVLIDPGSNPGSGLTSPKILYWLKRVVVKQGLCKNGSIIYNLSQMG
jgi:hypothetical protein